MTFSYLPKKRQIDTTISYISYVVLNLGRDFSWSYPVGGFINHDETEFDNMGWYDTEPKPTWSDIITYWELAYDYYGIMPSAIERITHLEDYQFDIDDQFVTTNTLIDGLDDRLDIIEAGSFFALATDTYTKTQVDTSLSGKAATSHTHAISDVTNLQTALNERCVVYNGTALVSNPKLVMKSGTVSSGQVVFYLTNDNTATGTALLTNIHGINVDINSSAASYGYSWAISNSNRTLTLTVVQPGSLLGLGVIPFTSASNGVQVNVRVYGN